MKYHVWWDGVGEIMCQTIEVKDSREARKETNKRIVIRKCKNEGDCKCH